MVEFPRIAAREVCTRRTVVRHEQRVSDEHSIFDLVSDVGRRMSWHMHHLGPERTDLKTLAILEQMIELNALARHVLEIEHRPENLLHLFDVLADADLGRGLRLEIGRSRQMIGMSMGLEHPDDARTLGVSLSQDSPGRFNRSIARAMIIVENRVNHRGHLCVAVPDEIAHRVGGLIEESLYGWKEFELEVMRDRADNVVIICGIENLDPMGVHTGDSITVAPIQTLTDREYRQQYSREVTSGLRRALAVRAVYLARLVPASVPRLRR